VLDPLRGFADTGSMPRSIMAMHHIIQVSNNDKVNAKMDLNNLLVQATKPIAIGDEIFVAHRTAVDKVKKVVDKNYLKNEKERIATQNRRAKSEVKEIMSYLTDDATLTYVNKE
jgi:hypothetical protein